MRRLLATGFGFGLAVSPSLVFAQQPGMTAPRSPVRIVAVRSTDDPTITARGQAGGMPMPPMGSPMSPVPMGSPIPMPMPGSGSSSPPPAQLGMPKPLGQGPSITEVPGGRPPQQPVPGMQGTPYSTPYPYQYQPQPGYPGATLGPASPVMPESPHPTTVYPQGGYGGSYPRPELDAPLFEGCYAPGVQTWGGYQMGGAPAPAPVAAAPAVGYGQLLAPYGPGGMNRWWLSAEYLLWFTKSAEYPALLTTSSPAFGGIQGSGDTRTIFGNGSFGDTLHSGGRFGIGRYFGCDQRWAFDGSVFFLGTNNNSFTANSADYPVLARPFTNVNQNIPFSEVITSPGLSVGMAQIDSEISLWGAEANLRRRLAGTSCARLDLIGGFRYLDLREGVRVTETFMRTPDSPTSIGVPNAMSGTVFDSFRTVNQFYGATVGLSGELRRGRWFSNLTTKVSLGTVYQKAIIDGGQQIVFDTGAIGTASGGLLTAPGANIGTYTQNKFAVVPEVGFNLGYQVTPNCRFFVGYNFLYLSSALRPGDQIDTNLDITRIPNFPVPGVSQFPVVRPTVPLKDKDFFAQGVSFGLQWRW
ncbi:BBP7 family outer membrane beta-barrel protein [Limnoglobus roseus]|uniref:BBP7 family outer membrane beta-barrel protein n=1 Tax=Limnoglobus roseus TaxID=2598579 RepID=A0A5C1AJY7_9BACT|nr:BBP7 family outer membrane beta-barrel protein [Limnoglobus roseus]QEL17228.1 hypothetical protein PX52LOC_04211 [Limnoglobus roseus]